VRDGGSSQQWPVGSVLMHLDMQSSATVDMRIHPNRSTVAIGPTVIEAGVAGFVPAAIGVNHRPSLPVQGCRVDQLLTRFDGRRPRIAADMPGLDEASMATSERR
jgi:hypothetical protein